MKRLVCSRRLFSPPPEADLSDLDDYVYPAVTECTLQITQHEVLVAIRRPKPDKASGPDGITNRVLQKGAKTVAKLLTPIFQACAEQRYHPRAYKEAHIIPLKKPQKDDYTTPEAWRSIALWNTIGKVLESMMTTKMNYLTEQHWLILDTQMGGRRGKSTETALELLTEQVHTVWGKGKDKVAVLLSIDVAGTFDTVSH